jgi:subtilisin family serine protease
VDVWAPGEDILGAVPGGGRGTFSGTSMASPHVAGVGAYLMALERIAPGAVCDRIKELAIDTIANPGRRTTGKLLFNGVAAGNLTQPIWMRNRFNRN